ncbi:eukaryotic rRNA processing protein EBP2-domain-containing protein [Dipodascopsis uninucleata]
MVSKLKTALDRSRGVDMQAKKLAVKLERKKKEKKLSEKKIHTRASLSFTEPPKKKSKKHVEEEEEEEEAEVAIDVEEEDEDEEDEDEEEEEEEDDDDDDDDDDNVSKPIIDISKLEDDLSSDSESESDSESIRPPKTEKTEKRTNAKKRDTRKIEEEEDGIPLSDLEFTSSDDDSEDKPDIIPYQKMTVNNTKALTQALHSIQLPLSSFAFSEHMSITSDEPTAIEDANNDLAREMSFYNQALDAAKKGRSFLLKEKIAFSRPEDYFAEMVKSDVHMEKLVRHHTQIAEQQQPKKRLNLNSSKKVKKAKKKSK